MYSHNYHFEPGFFQGNDPDVKLRKLNVSHQHPLFYKYCCNPERYEEYEYCFQQEFCAMAGLEKQMQQAGYSHIYHSLFPSYYETGTSETGIPYLITDYISGCTLDAVLCSAQNTSPRQILTAQQILHLFRQLDQAQFWLHKAGLIQLDLSPRNIIVCNHAQAELFTHEIPDIRLIDFTDAYYLSPGIRKKRAQWNRRHHLTNGLAERSIPPELQLQQAAAILFMLLFYKGQDDYGQHRPCESFFDKYGSLLNCIRVRPSSLFENDPDNFNTSDISLTYWSGWIHELSRILDPEF